MRFKIEEASEPDESKAIPVRLRVDEDGDLNLELETPSGWRVVVWISADGEIARSSTPPIGFRRRSE